MSRLYLGSSLIDTTYMGSSFQGKMQMAKLSPWERVVKACREGTYAELYPIGYTQELDLGTEGVVNMQVVAHDVDELADESGYAPLTWISKELLATSKQMNKKLVTNYKYEQGPSWAKSSSGSSQISNWWSKTEYCKDTIAEASWTITATKAGTITIKYNTSSANISANKLTLIVNGIEVVSDYCSPSRTSFDLYTVDVNVGDIVIVDALYYLYRASDLCGSVNFSTTGTFVVSANIQNATTRVRDSYEDGTGYIGGWPKTEMYTYINGIIKNLVMNSIPMGIKKVKKTYSYLDINGKSFVGSCANDCWIPSCREIFGNTSFEDSGPIYSNIYNSNAARIKTKYNSTSASSWWLRSASDADYTECVTTVGTNNMSSSVITPQGVVLGFCT